MGNQPISHRNNSVGLVHHRVIQAILERVARVGQGRTTNGRGFWHALFPCFPQTAFYFSCACIAGITSLLVSPNVDLGPTFPDRLNCLVCVAPYLIARSWDVM